jgi:hypothetical protein
MSGGAGPPKNAVNIVRRVTVDDDTLNQIAKLLGISDEDIAKGLSGVIYIGETTAPKPAAPTRSSGRGRGKK